MPNRADEAAASVSRSGEHEVRIRSCMSEAAVAGLKGFVVVGLFSTAAVVGATYGSTFFRTRLGPSGKAGIAVSVSPSSLEQLLCLSRSFFVLVVVRILYGKHFANLVVPFETSGQFSPALFWGFVRGEQQMTDCTRRP